MLKIHFNDHMFSTSRFGLCGNNGLIGLKTTHSQAKNHYMLWPILTGYKTTNLGAGCREFEPLHSDHVKILVNLRFTRIFAFLQKPTKPPHDHMLSHFHFQKPIKTGISPKLHPPELIQTGDFNFFIYLWLLCIKICLYNFRHNILQQHHPILL